MERTRTSGSEEDMSDDESESEDDDELDDAARLRKSLKSELKNVDKELDQGKNRLRKLGILQDGVEAEDSENDEDDDDEDDDDEDDDDEGSDDSQEIEDAHADVLREIEDEEDVEKEDASNTTRKSSQKEVSTAKEKKSSMPTRTDIPFTFPMPESAEDLNSILGDHNAEDAFTIITRIRACNAPTLAAENRKRIQTLLGLLLQRFEILAGQAPLPVDHLDVLSKHIVDLSAQVPFFAATAAKARVEKMSTRLRQALRAGETGWPPSRTVLLLSLFAAIFPTTDRSHPVMTPVTLYIGNLLAHCAIRSVRDAALAVILSTMASVYSTGAERIFPEALTLMNALIHCASRSKTNWAAGLSTHLVEQVGGPWLSSALTCTTDPMTLPEMLDGIYAEKLEEKKLSAATLRAALSCLRQLSKPVVKTASASEILSPVRDSVKALRKSLKKSNGGLAELCDELVKELDDALVGCGQNAFGVPHQGGGGNQNVQSHVRGRWLSKRSGLRSESRTSRGKKAQEASQTRNSRRHARIAQGQSIYGRCSFEGTVPSRGRARGAPERHFVILGKARSRFQIWRTRWPNCQEQTPRVERLETSLLEETVVTSLCHGFKSAKKQ